MIVDTSALIAILRDEPEAASCAHAIENSVVRRVSAANFVEAAVIIEPHDGVHGARSDLCHLDPLAAGARAVIPSPAGGSTT